MFCGGQIIGGFTTSCFNDFLRCIMKTIDVWFIGEISIGINYFCDVFAPLLLHYININQLYSRLVCCRCCTPLRTATGPWSPTRRWTDTRVCNQRSCSPRHWWPPEAWNHQWLVVLSNRFHNTCNEHRRNALLRLLRVELHTHVVRHRCVFCVLLNIILNSSLLYLV